MDLSALDRFLNALCAAKTAFVKSLRDPSGEAVVAPPVAAADEPVAAAPVVADEPVVAAPVVDADDSTVVAVPVVDADDGTVVAAAAASPVVARKSEKKRVGIALYSMESDICANCPTPIIFAGSTSEELDQDTFFFIKGAYISAGDSLYIKNCDYWECSDHPSSHFEFEVLKEGSPSPYVIGDSEDMYTTCTTEVYSYDEIVKRCPSYASERYVLLE
jgi:hypothetical protein